jgi:triphosphatase
MVQRVQRPQAAFRSALYEALARIDTSARGMLASDDPEFLHQLRVGQRRLRSVLRAFRKLLMRKDAKRLVRLLRGLSPKLGAARDWDVLVGRLERSAAPVQLLGRARAKRERARERARRAVRSKAFERLLARASALEARDSTDSLARFAAAALERAQRKLRRQDIDWADAGKRHAVRIRVKRLRYSCEFFASAFPGRRTGAYIADLKALQEILGELNDIAVGRRLLGFEADEAALLRRLGAVWKRFEKRTRFWRAAR